MVSVPIILYRITGKFLMEDRDTSNMGGFNVKEEEKVKAGGDGFGSRSELNTSQ